MSTLSTKKPCKKNKQIKNQKLLPEMYGLPPFINGEMNVFLDLVLHSVEKIYQFYEYQAPNGRFTHLEKIWTIGTVQFFLFPLSLLLGFTVTFIIKVILILLLSKLVGYHQGKWCNWTICFLEATSKSPDQIRHIQLDIMCISQTS